MNFVTVYTEVCEQISMTLEDEPNTYNTVNMFCGALPIFSFLGMKNGLGLMIVGWLTCMG